MSLINHIIIPIVGSRQNLQETNIFKHTCFNLTPQKGPLLSEPILWKKSMSAFKKFKQKKDKKDKNSLPSSTQYDLLHNQKHNVKYKLIAKVHRPLRNTDNYSGYQNYDQCLAQLLYFDPNEAPLYEFNASELFPTASAKQTKAIIKHESLLPFFSDTRMLKAETEPMQEENQIIFSIEPRSDDPFIIVRKGNLKKSSKVFKSKPIKKEKWEKITSRQQEEDLSPDRKRIQVQCSSIKNRLQEKNSEKESSQQNLRKINRQIFTLTQIMKSAFQEKVEENRKNAKQKDSVSRELNFGQPKVNNE